MKHTLFWLLLGTAVASVTAVELWLWVFQRKKAFDFSAPVYGTFFFLLGVIAVQFLVILRLKGWL